MIRKYAKLSSCLFSAKRPRKGRSQATGKTSCAQAMLLCVLKNDDIILREYLETFLSPQRIERMRGVLRQRTRYIVCVLEDLYDPRNGSAVMRHCDALGIQEIHAIENRNRFKTDRQVHLGTAQWLDLHIHRETAGSNSSSDSFLNAAAHSVKVANQLKENGYRIIATSPHEGEKMTAENLDLQAGPVAVVFGTEKHGISETLREKADAFIQIPMFGFVESFNISASAAIVLHVLSGRMHQEGIPWKLDKEDAEEIYLRWVKSSVPHCEAIIRRFRQEG